MAVVWLSRIASVKAPIIHHQELTSRGQLPVALAGSAQA